LRPKQQNLKKPLLGFYPKEPEFQNSEFAGNQVGPKLQLSSSYGIGCGHKFLSTAAAAAADGFFVFSRFMTFYR
jgi:hypothetical protein